MSLDHNGEAAAYFSRANRHTQAGYRRALRDAGIELPVWAQDRRNVPTKPMCTQSNATHSTDLASAVTLPPGFTLPVDPEDEDDALNAVVLG